MVDKYMNVVHWGCGESVDFKAASKKVHHVKFIVNTELKEIQLQHSHNDPILKLPDES